MDIELLQRFLGWSIIINYGLLLWWFLALVLAHDWVYRLHTLWFDITLEQFDGIHYLGLALYKVGLILFLLVPWLVLKFFL